MSKHIITFIAVAIIGFAVNESIGYDSSMQIYKLGQTKNNCDVAGNK